MAGASGRFIVFEGGEGTGKSTQAALLAERLGAELTREPGGTALGERVRELLLVDAGAAVAARAELLLMAAARAQHVAERIRPALEAGRDVVSDRFSGSTLAYQGYGRGLPLEDVLVACELAVDGLQPDLTVLLDLPPGLAAPRRHGVADRIEAESAAFHDRVYRGFRSLAAADPNRWVLIDAGASIAEVAARVVAAVESRLGHLPGLGRAVTPRPESEPVAVFNGIVGQERALALLRSSLAAPVHAYLFYGPPGSGKRRAARAFAAALVCPTGGCGNCPACRDALAGRHLDITRVERQGASILVGDARAVAALAQRAPAVARRAR